MFNIFLIPSTCKATWVLLKKLLASGILHRTETAIMSDINQTLAIVETY